MSDQHQPPGGNHPQQGSQNPYAAPADGRQDRPQQYADYQQQKPTGGPGLGITALILGILAIITSFFVFGGYLFGIPAIIVGAIGSSKAKKGRATGRGMAITGIVTGVIALLISIGLTIFTVFLFQAADFGSLQECVQQAGNDQAAQAECERQFQDQLENKLNN